MHLITYTQANSDIVNSPETFSVIVLDSFENADRNCRSQVKQWVYSEQLHKDGETLSYGSKIGSKSALVTSAGYADNKHGVKLHISSTHTNYYFGWKYVTKRTKIICNRTVIQICDKHRKLKRSVTSAKVLRENVKNLQNGKGSLVFLLMKYLRLLLTEVFICAWNC